MQSKEDFIEMRVPASAEYVSLIRLTLSGVFSRAGATYDDIEDAKIAVSEAVTNAVKHAYKENNNVGIINIYFEILEDKIKFEAFLVPTVIGEIKRYLRDKTWSVHVPRRIKEIGPRIKKVSDELTAELERSPSISEIANRLEVSEEEVLEAMEMGQSYNALSVDHSIEADKDGSTVTLLDIMGQQDDHYDLTEKRMILEKILPILSDREREIIQCTFIEGLSQKETGERIGLSQMHVSRLQRTAIKKLQEAAHK